MKLDSERCMSMARLWTALHNHLPFFSPSHSLNVVQKLCMKVSQCQKVHGPWRSGKIFHFPLLYAKLKQHKRQVKKNKKGKTVTGSKQKTQALALVLVTCTVHCHSSGSASMIWLLVPSSYMFACFCFLCIVLVTSVQVVLSKQVFSSRSKTSVSVNEP